MIGLFAVPLIFYSCSTMTSIIAEFPKNPPNPVPDHIQSLLLVNRIPSGSLSDNHTDTLQSIFYRENYNLDTTLIEMASVDTILYALGELLFESGRFDYLIPEGRFLNKDNQGTDSLMTGEEVISLCRKFNTDAILSLEHLNNSISCSLDRESYYDSDAGGFRRLYKGKLQIIYDAHFRIYDPAGMSESKNRVLTDTIIWEYYDPVLRNVLKELPPVKEALIESGIYLANKLRSQIAPEWVQGTRKIFSRPSGILGMPMKYVDENDWKPAMEIWEEMANGQNSRSMRSKAGFNLAVGYELEGNLGQAIRWGIKSYETMFRQVTFDYLLLLKNKLDNPKTRK